MSEVEPEKLTAMRAALGERLGLDPDVIEVQERRTPGEQQDEPLYLTVLIPRTESLDDETITAALDAVREQMWMHPAAPFQPRWVYKS